MTEATGNFYLEKLKERDVCCNEVKKSVFIYPMSCTVFHSCDPAPRIVKGHKESKLHLPEETCIEDILKKD